jgi:hypothetical protein
MQNSEFPVWARIVSIMLLLWSLVGLWAFYTQSTMTSEMMAQLPAGEQAIWSAMPGWLWGVYAIAVLSGFAGAVLLLMRKALSVPLYLISLVAIVIQFGYVFAATPLLGTVGPTSMIFPLFIFAMGAVALWLARSWRDKGWIG